jgi:hypothetical protein
MMMEIQWRFIIIIIIMSLNSVIGIATGEVRVRVPVGSRIFSSQRRPDQLWGPPSLLSSGYPGHFPQGQNGRGVKFMNLLQLCRGQENVDLYVHTPYFTIHLNL